MLLISWSCDLATLTLLRTKDSSRIQLTDSVSVARSSTGTCVIWRESGDLFAGLFVGNDGVRGHSENYEQALCLTFLNPACSGGGIDIKRAPHI